MKTGSLASMVCAVLAGLCVCAAWGQDEGAPPSEEMRKFGPGGEGPGMHAMMKNRPGKGAGGLVMVIEEILKDSEKVKSLGLTDEQVNSLKTGLATAKKDEDDLRKQQEENAMAQGEKIADDTIDENALMKLIDAGGEIHTKLAKNRVQRIILIKKTLTAEQISKAKEMVREIIKKRAQEWREKDRSKRDKHKKEQESEEKSSDTGSSTNSVSKTE